MKRRISRPAVVVGLVVIVAALVAVTLGVGRGSLEAAKPAKLSLDPDMLSKQSLPAVKRTPLGDPTLAALQELAARAYPASSVTQQEIKGARDFFNGSIKARGAAGNGSWQLAGPDTATVAPFLNRTSASYVTSGRVTAEAIAPTCAPGNCRLWIAAAGGGIWRTDDALASTPAWSYVSGSFGTNAIGALTYDAASNTLYAGTGEPNASGDSESGVGIYKSTDGGSSWSLLPGSPAATNARSISSIVVDPSNANTIYVGTTRGVRGVSSVTGGAVSLAPNAPAWGLYRTTDGGNSFAEVWNGAGSPRGVNHVEIDSHGVVYAAAFQEGIWRSADGASNWEQIFATKDQGDNGARTEFALAKTADGHTRIYVGDGGTEDQSQLADDSLGYVSNTGVYRADSVDTTASADLLGGGSDSGYTSLTSSDPTNPGFATYDYCEGQCWYDNFVVSPAGHPDTVYVAGSYDYNRQPYGINHGNAVLLSQDAGATWNDQTADTQSPTNGLHPDQHALVVNPSNPLQFFEGSDGGMMRSSGELTDASGNCPDYGSPYNEECANVTKAVPTGLASMNTGLSTLQFQSVSVNPASSGDLIAGTQDNGTWAGQAGNFAWSQSIWGDGGQAGFDSGNSHVRFTNFYSPYSDVNFQDGDMTKWVFVGNPWLDNRGTPQELSAFYLPEIADPATAGTLFIGLQHVWRTLDDGGDQAELEANCPEQEAYHYTRQCGDWVPLGDPTGQGSQGAYAATQTYTPGDLTASGVYGTDRAGGYVVATARTPSDKSTLWAATATGRVFISQNADAADAGSVVFTRLDSLSSSAPGRFVSGIVVDPTNANHAWISYTGYNANTPGQPGHVFDVTYDPTAHTATWTDIDQGTGPLGDLPVTGIARDDQTGQLYAATDFGVLAATGTSGKWQLAASGMPTVEVAGITMDSAHRVLYAATHGRAIWALQLSGSKGKSGKH